jgi:hypothetical protein
MWLGGRLKLDQQAVFPEDRGSNRAADSNTILARRASECGMLRARTIACSAVFSDSLITKAVFGRPILLNLRPHLIR